MKWNKDDIEFLEQADRYLLNEMGEEERNDFEKIINANSELKEQVELIRVVNNSLENKKTIEEEQDLEEFKKLLQEIEEKRVEEPSLQFEKKYAQEAMPENTSETKERLEPQASQNSSSPFLTLKVFLIFCALIASIVFLYWRMMGR